MKIVLPGGSGQVGTILARSFHQAGHDVVVLSRAATAAPWRVAPWDARTLGDWAHELDGADVVVNLAGRSVNCRYTPENRRLIKESRVQSAEVIGEAISQCKHPPRVWLQMSTATIYAHRYDAPNDETTGVIGGAEPDAPPSWRFSIDVAQSWERAVDRFPTPNTRKLLLRSAVVMSPDHGGPFDLLLKLVRYRLGGRNGDGRQYVSWIHDADFVRAVEFLIQRDDFDGAVNLASPAPEPNAEFMRKLRAAWGVRLGLPSTEWMLALGAFFLRTETELALKSRRVVPARLEQAGFVFQFPEWEAAARDLCTRWRQG